MNYLIIKIPGYPRPQPRGRIAGQKVGPDTLKNPRIVSIIDIKAQAWANAIHRAAQNVLKDIGGVKVAEDMLGGRTDPLAMKVVFRMPTKHPAKYGKWHSEAAGSDLDNLEKIVMDVLLGTKGAPFGSNDSRACHKEGIKIWSSYADAGALVLLKRCESVDSVIAKMLGEFRNSK